MRRAVNWNGHLASQLVAAKSVTRPSKTTRHPSGDQHAQPSVARSGSCGSLSSSRHGTMPHPIILGQPDIGPHPSDSRIRASAHANTHAAAVTSHSLYYCHGKNVERGERHIPRRRDMYCVQYSALPALRALAAGLQHVAAENAHRLSPVLLPSLSFPFDESPFFLGDLTPVLAM